MTEPAIISATTARRIEGMFAAIDARDWTALPTFFHPAMVYERPGYEPFAGRDRIMRFYREERVILRGRHTLDGTIAENDRAAAWGRIEAVHTDGRPIALGFADVYLFEQGTIILRRSHFFVPAV
jgi:ketosteroid isomerase-like protein